jgi:hypothetical protein
VYLLLKITKHKNWSCTFIAYKGLVGHQREQSLTYMRGR